MTMRPRLHDILTDALAGEADVEMLDISTRTPAGITSAIPDVVVCESADPLDAGPPARILREVPRARVLMVADSGDRAALFELRVMRTVMSTIGMDDIVSAIRNRHADGLGTCVAEPPAS